MFAIMNIDEKFIRRCFLLAKQGLGNVAPNPLVGCVIVKNGEIIGEGFHKKYGDSHAEVNAVNSVKNKSEIENSDVYVNLEPCSHYGKTPPCADMLITHRIKRVIVSNLDPNPLVNGKGVEKLRQAGIEVVTDILEEEGRELNKRFLTFFKKQRPYIILKWAQTLDGFIDIKRDLLNKSFTTTRNNWITNDQLKILVHKWRSEEQAILIGTNTALNDNPQLNTRFWTGKSPIRMVIDKELVLSSNLNIFDQSLPTVVFTSVSKQNVGNIEYHQVNFNNNTEIEIFNYCFNKNIQSIIIEGGKELLESFINKGLWDEARILIGDKKFNQGLKAPCIEGEIVKKLKFGNDEYKCLKPQALNY